MLRLVIFDVDGTLIDSEALYIKSALENCRLNGYSISLDTIMSTIGRDVRSIRGIISSAGGEGFDYDKYLENLRKIRNEIVKKEPIELKKGALDILRFCKEERLDLAFATSTFKYKQEPILEALDILSYFDFCVYGDEISNSKPSPDIYLKVLDHFNHKKDEVIIFEDSINGILSAHNAGVRVVCVPDKVKIPDDISKLAYKTVDDLDKGIDVIKEFLWNRWRIV